MEEKKYIDRLYQEKFKDFEAAPREDLWREISAKLREDKRKSRVAPLWTKIAGVAAVLSLILLIGEWLTQPLQNSVVTNEKELLRDSPSENVWVASTESPDDALENRIEEALPSPTQLKIAPDARRTDELLTASTLSVTKIKEVPLSTEGKNLPAGNKISGVVSRDGKRSLLEVLQESQVEKEISANTSKSRLEISTHAAPIYYGNMKSGNFIDPKFRNNSSEGEVTYSYGLNIAYAISDKLKIRSGVSKVSMSHNTNDIAFNAVLGPVALQSIDYRNNLRFEVVDGPISWKGSPSPVASSNRSSLGNINQGLLNQKIGYIEVPLELEYNIIDKNISVNIIGGASTLFLDENMISITSGKLATVLGEANNVKDVSFSTNLGVGLDYNVTEHFKLNLEPMFKYQINTFDAASGTYQPYYLGVYSGFSYEF